MWKVVKQVQRPLIIVGAGNLGSTLAANFNDFEGKGLKVVAAFDHDPKKCGTQLGHIKAVEHVSNIYRVTKEHGAKIAILAIQGDNVQEATKMIVDAGISTILSYSSVSLVVPNHVHVEYMDPALKLQMSFAQPNYNSYHSHHSHGSRSSSAPPFVMPISPFLAHVSQYVTPLLTAVSKYYRVPAISRGVYNIRSRGYGTYTGGSSSVFPQYANRYANDFEEYGILGKGGFGSVFKARNHMDGMDYAVKKVTINVTPLSLATITDHKYLREVRAMARLNHHNLVRYYYAWLEYGEQSENTETAEDFTESSGMMSVSAQDENTDGRTCEGDSLSSAFSVTEESAGTEHHENIKLVLYIQMELCAGLTLKDWMIRPDRIIDVKQCYNIISQIVQGLKHIHSHGFIHRDVTPPNIFLELVSRDIIVKIGDFGLVKHCSDLSNDREPLLHKARNGQTMGVGTYLYASPEQLSGMSYDTKSDMYSVGVIFFELLSAFGTQMERILQLTKIKSGRRVPIQLSLRYPLESEIIESLLNEMPASRPSAEEVLVRIKM